MNATAQRIFEIHRARYGEAEIAVRAPGRINLIGEHTDYNDGLVLPAAINRGIVFAASTRGDDQVRIFAADLSETDRFNPGALEKSERGWPNYLRGVMDEIQRITGKLLPRGLNISFGGDLPLGAGLSASAALTAGFAWLVNELFQLAIETRELALLAQRVEHTWAGVNCGVMDPYTVLFARCGHSLLLDCRSLSHRYVAFPSAHASILLADSGVRHALASSAYNQRRRECEQAVAIISRDLPGVRALRDVPVEQLDHHRDRLGDVLYRRARFALAENERVAAFAGALDVSDLPAAGRLLNETQRGLRDEYEVSCPEVDMLAEIARSAMDVYGARMIGGGFGGMVLALVKAGEEERVTNRIGTEYQRRTGLNCVPFTVCLTSPVNLIEKQE